MKSVCVCRGCGRTIESDFIYCPWCGLSRVDEEDRRSLDAVFSKLEQMQSASREKRVSTMESRLNKLEQELSVLALSAEMHK
jgi:predicted Fe-S protein YdhL (DUF1289 family)